MSQTPLPERLPLEVVAAGTHWHRIHSLTHDPLWFGPSPGTSVPVNRFDDPSTSFRVCYLGATLEACFAETFLRNPPIRVLSLRDLSARAVSTITLVRALRLVPLYGPGLARSGITAEIASGPSYTLSQSCSRRLWEHRDAPDGIAYHSRHDDETLCIALYDRARTALAVSQTASLIADPATLAGLLKRYCLGLTP